MTPLVIFVLAWAGGILLAQAALFSPVWLLLGLPIAFFLRHRMGDHRSARLAAFAMVGCLARGAC